MLSHVARSHAPVFLVALAPFSKAGAETPSAKKSPLAPIIQSFVDQQFAPGVVALIANRDRVVALETAGFASLANQTPIREDAIFWIASMSKSLTGTALMMLVDEGKVRLDDPVEKYLPEFKGQMVAGPDGNGPPQPPAASDHRLRNHEPHQGLVLASEKTLKRTQVLKDDVSEYAKQSLRQEPGEVRVQQLRDQHRRPDHRLSYADFMQQRLFDPLGMKRHDLLAE